MCSSEKRQCVALEYECENEYDYELEREIENETRALAREDDEYEQLARTCDEYYDAHSSERAPSEYSKECEDVASESTASTVPLEASTQEKLRRALRSIRPASRAREGLQGWARGGLFPPVRVTTIRIEEPQLARFDETRTQYASDGTEVEFAPLVNGTTVISMGMGGMKTVRLVEFVESKRVATVCVSGRRNLAHMFATKLKDVRNYLDAPEGESVAEWCNHARVVISIEQVDKLLAHIETYRGGILVIDEVCTVADSIRRGGTTVRWPERTIMALRRLSETCKYTILMDADVDYDGKTEAFMRCIAPMRDVRHFQGTCPAMQRTLFVGFRARKSTAHSERFNDWKDLCLYRARDARRSGKPNRVFYGGSTPKEVVDQIKAAEKLGVHCLPTGYHGKMSDKVRKEHFRDPNKAMEPYDLVATSTVMAVGTDLDLKFSHAFFETRRGHAMSELPSNQTVAQLTGRPGRSLERPLDDLVLGGVKYNSAMFMLMGVGVPEVTDEELEEADDASMDRVDRKFHVLAKDERAVLDAMRDADQSARAEYMRAAGLQVQLPSTSGDSRACYAPVAIASEPKLENDIADLLRWNVVSHKDQHEAHARSLLELLTLPTRAYRILEIPELPDKERAELAAYRGEETSSAPERVLSDDEKWGRITSAVERYAAVRDELIAMQVVAEFWADCCGYVERRDGVARSSPDARVHAYCEVWGVLRRVREFVSEELYVELYHDKDRCNVYNRALMRFVPLEILKSEYVELQERGKVGDTMSQASLPASHKLEMLQELARVLKLDSAEQLLTPQTFDARNSVWVAVHNRLQLEDPALHEDVSVRERARECAVKMGCKSIRSGARGTTLLGVVENVLKQQCAMKVAEKRAGKRKGREDERATRTTLELLRSDEVAPGCAQSMLVYCRELREYGASADDAYVPASEYASRIERARRSSAQDARLRELSVPQFEDTPSVLAPPLVFDVDAYDPMVMYEPIDADALLKLLENLKLDERERRAAVHALGLEMLSRDSSEAKRLRDQLLKLESAHMLLARLDTELSEPDEDGRRTRRVQYKQSSESRCRPTNVRTFKDAKGEPRSTTLQGMFSDLRAPLTGRFLFDVDGVHSGPTLMLEIAHRAGYDIHGDESLRNLRECIERRGEWTRSVAAHHGVESDLVKRWPTMIVNGAGYNRLLVDAGLREDAERDASRVVPLIEELEKLRRELTGADEIKVFSKMIFKLENEALQTIVAAVRKMNRDAAVDAFDERPARRRDVGALVFDGAMLELEPGVRARGEEAVEREVNRALRKSGFVRYCVKIKRNFGLQDDAVPLVEDARAALDEASATYPDVLAAVERVRSEECMQSEGHESIEMQSEAHESIESIERSIEMYSSDEEF